MRDAAPVPPSPSAPRVTVSLAVHLATGRRGRKRLVEGPSPADQAAHAEPTPQGRVPRVARMMALAIHWQGLIRAGAARDQADLARLVGVSRARVTQVMDLLRLAPDIQEAVLYLPPVNRGRGPKHERALRRIAAEPLWEVQRMAWARLAPCEA